MLTQHLATLARIAAYIEELANSNGNQRELERLRRQCARIEALLFDEDLAWAGLERKP